MPLRVPAQAASGGRYVRARAPLRLGFAGGGTDVSPYCDDHGGAVLNACVALYARVDLAPRTDGRVSFIADDVQEVFEHPADSAFELSGQALLHKGVYSRFMADFNKGRPLAMTIHTSVEAPQGSGLGSSSALVVSLVQAFLGYFRVPMDEYELARYAFDIERNDLGLAGGKQDQYAAAFGGFNFMEFRAGGSVVVTPLRVHVDTQRELESAIVLFYFGKARQSAEIIKQQQANMTAGAPRAIDALHEMKREAFEIKDAMLCGDLNAFADVLNRGWEAKKRTASAVSSPRIEELIAGAKDNGAVAAKISGAGGGGFLLLVADPMRRTQLLRYLDGQNGLILPCRFTQEGAHSWRA